MPAAAVIPAPGVSMVDAAVKRFVVLLVVHVLCACALCGLWMCAARGATDGGHWIVGREVKCDDPDWTD